MTPHTAIDVPGVSACSACVAGVVHADPATAGAIGALIGPVLWLLVRLIADEIQARRAAAKKKPE